MSSGPREFDTINFDTDQFFNQDRISEAIRLPPWVDPDKKIQAYRRRRQNHIIKRDDYADRFKKYQVFLRKTKIGDQHKPPTQSFLDFADKVRIKVGVTKSFQ